MKKTTLLSLAAATSLAFSASSNTAHAEAVQSKTNTNKVMYTAPFAFNFQAVQFGNVEQLLKSIFGDNFVINNGHIVKPPTNNGNNGGTVTPPANNDDNGETVTPPTNNGDNGETVTPPTNNGDNGETVTPPTNNGNNGGTVTPPANNSDNGETVTPPTGSLSQFEQKVVDLTNAERAKYGLAALKVDTALSNVARIKSQDMLNKNYFSHTSPTYGSPFDMMKQFGISYRTAGENIAMGQRTPEEVVQAWMNSSGHRANILNNTYTHIGVGYVAQKNIWTQMFISK
ncbi:CAP domain-containing protein [Bacillus sp. 165]|uniref:CAP domain-containing protein n=1 Tax=Bacillus sp. 165 TaxID=1529117 RepID=UPI001AD9C065|nr:CAP domain-containing protein [Bacillus sp. 165]MBO9128478.1 serine protease [Bacillus sp. 165]